MELAGFVHRGDYLTSPKVKVVINRRQSSLRWLCDASSAVNASEHFIGAVIDDDMGNVLEYRHLIKSDKHKRIWEQSFTNKLG